MIGGTALLLVASQYDGDDPTVLWALALLADYGGTYLGGASGWRLRSAGHFAERHGLILIVALGESIVALGVGAAELPISWPIVAGSVAGPGAVGRPVVGLLRHQPPSGRARPGQEPEATRPRLARDAYSFLHFPIVVGVVVLASDSRRCSSTSATPSTTAHRPSHGHRAGRPVGGVVIYLLGHVAFKWLTVAAWSHFRLATARGAVPAGLAADGRGAGDG